MPGSSNELYSKSFERRGAAQSGLLGSSLNVSPKYVVYVTFMLVCDRYFRKAFSIFGKSYIYCLF